MAGRPLTDRVLSAEPLQIDGSSQEDNDPNANEIYQENETVWTDCNILTFDGGGIRGYWSLLAMKQLMDHIAQIEMAHLEGEAAHSFAPQDYPEEVSQLLHTESEQRLRRTFPDSERVKWLDTARRYLPCHYFDYIGGTSTGALIAIMLGRLRMPVIDCLHEYAKVGNEIFGNPPRFKWARMYLTKMPKYNTSRAEKAYKDVMKRRAEDKGKGLLQRQSPQFPSKKGMCHTFATALAEHEHQGKPFIIRSYEFSERPNILPAERQKPLTRRKTKYACVDFDRNRTQSTSAAQERPTVEAEPPHPLPVWQVARAATAATKYFKPSTVDLLDGKVIFEDAGVRIPNPTSVAISEIETKHGKEAIGVVVSVGTAKSEREAQAEAGAEYIKGAAERVAAIATDPEPTHLEVERLCNRNEIEYFRLNPVENIHRLNIELDAWYPRNAQKTCKAGERTLSEMARCFDKWYRSSPGVKEMFENCASELVERRRARVRDTAKWERYIIGSDFLCPQLGCSQGHRYTFRDGFEQHWEITHKQHSVDPIGQLPLQVERSRHIGWKYQKVEKEASLAIERYC